MIHGENDAQSPYRLRRIPDGMQGMLNKEFCIPLEELVDELAQPMSTADIAELTIQLQIGKVIKD